MGLSNTCIIVAAGSGKRMHKNVKKQFINLEGKPLLAHTLKVFQDFTEIDRIVLVVSLNDIEYVSKNIIKKYSFDKVTDIVSGGKTRQESVMEGIKVVNKSEIIIIHDGARPFITSDIIKQSIKDAKEFGASVVAVNEKNTIKIKDKNGFVVKTLNRNNVVSIQTPQSFKYEIIKKAHKNAINNNFVATDDSTLVENIGIQVKITKGSYENIKITTPDDMVLAQQILKHRRK